MITLHFVCPSCGQVEVDGYGVRLHLMDQALSYFSLSCPLCGGLMGGKIPTKMAQVLRDLGLQSSSLPFCLELLEPKTHHQMTPLTEDEIQSFIAFLDLPDVVEFARRSTGAGDN